MPLSDPKSTATYSTFDKVFKPPAKISGSKPSASSFNNLITLSNFIESNFFVSTDSNESLPKYKLVVTIEEGVTDGGFGEGVINWSNKKNIENSILTLGVPNKFVDHGPRNILLEEIGLDSMTLFEKIYNFSRKSNE